MDPAMKSIFLFFGLVAITNGVPFGYETELQPQSTNNLGQFSPFPSSYQHGPHDAKNGRDLLPSLKYGAPSALSSNGGRQLHGSHNGIQLNGSPNGIQLNGSPNGRQLHGSNNGRHLHGTNNGRQLHGSNNGRLLQSSNNGRQLHGSNNGRQLHGSNNGRQLPGSNNGRQLHGSNNGRQLHGSNNGRQILGPNKTSQLHGSGNGRQLTSFPSHFKQKPTNAKKEKQLFISPENDHEPQGSGGLPLVELPLENDEDNEFLGSLGGRQLAEAPSSVTPYEFQWNVDDEEYQNYYGHLETASETGRVEGSYYNLLPDGSLQTVNYYVDGDSGFVPTITYEQDYSPLWGTSLFA